MPAYFSVSFIYNKKHITKHLIQDFYEHLIDCGLSFKSGYWGFECDTLQEIIEWNQAKLEDNFELGYTEHYSHDYKQVKFFFHNFSEVRVFILNTKESDSFSFELIIPENDFLQYTHLNRSYEVTHLYEKMLLIKKLMEDMWQSDIFSSIQTSWEGSESVISSDDIFKGVKPLIEPYAIVPSELFHHYWNCQSYKIGNNGMMLIDDNNWNL